MKSKADVQALFTRWQSLPESQKRDTFCRLFGVLDHDRQTQFGTRLFASMESVITTTEKQS